MSTFSPDMTDELRQLLLRGINPNRVGRDGKGFSHVQAYDIRAHLNRCFDFLGWSAETVKMELVFEEVEKDRPKLGRDKKPTGEIYDAWTVCYRAQVRLIVGIAVYTEWATGDSSNQPSRADAHDMALKTAESQALKRAAANLGDQFGLSLYAKGSLEPLVKGVAGHLKREEALEGSGDVTAHITAPLPVEDETPAWVDTTDAPDPRSTNAPVGTLQSMLNESLDKAADDAGVVPAWTVEEIKARTEAITKARR